MIKRGLRGFAVTQWLPLLAGQFKERCLAALQNVKTEEPSRSCPAILLGCPDQDMA
jgi:hypothetical protein